MTIWLLDAYQFLDPLRKENVGMGGVVRGFIPVSEIVAYANAFPLLVELDEFVNVIRAVDVEYIKLINLTKSSDQQKKAI